MYDQSTSYHQIALICNDFPYIRNRDIKPLGFRRQNGSRYTGFDGFFVSLRVFRISGTGYQAT